MKNSHKYYNLEYYLKQSNQDFLRLSFRDIESILGFKLPPSANKYPAIWSNSDSHPIAVAWMNAGYVSENLDLRNQTIAFRRKPILKFNRTSTSQNIRDQSFSPMTAEHAIQLIQSYFHASINDDHSRYKSWIHCYKIFSENRGTTDPIIIDYLALHLAFYLASWGMYRGSSFLLQKDYKIHIPVVKIIQEHTYHSLLGISADNLLNEKNLELLDNIGIRIKNYYAKEIPSIRGAVNNATDTLISKILLGTLGCVPAYDRYYVQSVKKYHISSGVYSKESISCIAQFYHINSEKFEKLRKEISSSEIEYPPMKLMDMCFWQDAYLNDLQTNDT